MDMSGRAVKPWQIQSKTTHIDDNNDNEDDDDMDDKCDNDTDNMHDFNFKAIIPRCRYVFGNAFVLFQCQQCGFCFDLASTTWLLF